MVRDDKMPFNLDPTGDRIGFPDEGLAASIPMVNLLPPMMSELYSGMRPFKTPDADAL